MQSPLKQNGQYRFRVIYNDKECEIIEMTVLNNKVHIDGSNWFGIGIVVGEDGDYVGYTNLSIGLAFHDMEWFNDRFIGGAVYEVGTCDNLQWRLIQ